jgi:hypothetical protein
VSVVCEEVDVCGRDRTQMAKWRLLILTCMIDIVICIVTRPPLFHDCGSEIFDRL